MDYGAGEFIIIYMCALWEKKVFCRYITLVYVLSLAMTKVSVRNIRLKLQRLQTNFESYKLTFVYALICSYTYVQIITVYLIQSTEHIATV